MSIPKISDGQLLAEVRLNSLNPAIDKVNTMGVQLEAVSAIASGNTGVISTLSNKTAALEAFVNNIHEDVATIGTKYKVDYRVFDFTSTGAQYSVVIQLEAEEFPVRAVVRTFSNNTGTFAPVSTITFNRTTNTLTFNVGNARSGKIYCEFWGPV